LRELLFELKLGGNVGGAFIVDDGFFVIWCSAVTGWNGPGIYTARGGITAEAQMPESGFLSSNFHQMWG
jgi:hypothetical protein